MRETRTKQEQPNNQTEKRNTNNSEELPVRAHVPLKALKFRVGPIVQFVVVVFFFGQSSPQ